MFIIVTLFTVVRGYNAIIAVSSMTVQNSVEVVTLKSVPYINLYSLVCHPALFIYFLRCT